LKEQTWSHGESRPVVAITKRDDEGAAIRDSLAELPLEAVLPRGATVVLVPNWVKARPPETGTVVGPGSLRVLIEELKKLSPGRQAAFTQAAYGVPIVLDNGKILPVHLA